MSKCIKEDGIGEDDQPLYIDTETESIKCHWCAGLFKGSIEVRAINQHVKSSKTHLKERKNHLNPATEEGVCDIRTYFK